jgi:cobalt-zinc-cadmium resistance protein CzcA
VASGIVIIIIVFLPLLTLEGLEGKMFGPVALTIVFALSASLMLSLTVVPVLASFLIKRGGHHEPWLVRKLQAALRCRVLASALGHGRTLGHRPSPSPLVAAAGAYLAARQDLHADHGRRRHHHAAGKAALDRPGPDHRHRQAVQQAILRRAGVKAIVARSGSDELGLDPMGLNQTDTFMVLQAPRHLAQPDKAWLADQLRAVMADFPGIGFDLHPADRHARLGDADRRARRPRDQDLRARSATP